MLKLIQLNSTSWLMESLKTFQPKFYDGSRLLESHALRSGLRIDQFNFLFCQGVALVFAFPFRKHLSLDNVSVTTRHIVEIVGGVLLSYFCFGYQFYHLVVQSIVSYALMNYGGDRLSHSVVFGWCFLYLSVCHVFHMVYDYGGWTLDITGPLMIQTMKITALAFALHDGRFKDQDNLSEDQRNQAVRKMPNMLEYLSFMFYFHGIMVGPNTFYKDYIAFIDGSNLKNAKKHSSPLSRQISETIDTAKSEVETIKNKNSLTRRISWGMDSEDSDEDGLSRAIRRAVFKKLALAGACATLMVFLNSWLFPIELLHSRTWYSMHFFEKWFFLYCCTFVARLNYYFIWKFASAVNIAAGFGFSDYDDDGNAVFDLTDNVDIRGVELSTSIEETFSSWDKQGRRWLQRVVTERCESYPVVWTALVHALVHGFYPGYYLTFCVVAAVVATSQQVREHIRSLLQFSDRWRLSYDGLSFLTARLATSYLFFPYLLVLEFLACFFMYKSLYFYLHMVFIVSNIMMVFLLGIKEANKGSGAEASTDLPADGGSAKGPKKSGCGCGW